MKRLILFFGLMMPAITMAQQTVQPTFPDVNTVDLKDPESVANAMLGVLSGAAEGKSCDWDLWRLLHTPNSQSYALVNRPDTAFTATIDTETFVTRFGPNYEGSDFWEYQTDIKVDRFRNVATVYQNYEMRQKWEDGVIARGVNMHLLVFYNDRWWIASSTWDNEFLRQPGH